MLKILSVREDGYRYYRHSADNPISGEHRFSNIVNGFIKLQVEKLLRGDEVQLSNGNTLGSILVKGRKIDLKIREDGTVKGLQINWKATMDYWKEHPSARERKQKIYYFNDHSEYVKYNLVWRKSGIKVANNQLYMMDFSHRLRKKLSDLIHAGKEYNVFND